MKKKITVIIVLMILIISLFYFFNKKENSLNINLATKINDLDFHKYNDESTGIVLGNIFEGLTVTSKEGKVISGVAESWTHKGNLWTFYLRKNGKWQNGETVKAEDFLNGWKRLLDSEKKFQFAYNLYYIKGAMAYNQGVIKDFSDVGVKVIDDFTLQVELTKNIPCFDSIVSQSYYYPMNNKSYNKNYELKEIIGNGPFKLDNINKREKIILIKNKKYWDKKNVNIDRINLNFIGNSEEKLKSFKDKENVISIINEDDNTKYENFKELNSIQTGKINYLEFNLNSSIFSNKKVRKAFSLAIDKENLLKTIKNNSYTVSNMLIPEGITGDKSSFRKEFTEKNNLGYNKELANKLFLEGLKEQNISKEKISSIIFLVKANSEEINIANYLKNQFKEVLNINLKIVEETSQMRKQMILSNNFDITLSEYKGNINDPVNYLEVWTSKNFKNEIKWKNDNFDKLIEESLFANKNKLRMDYLSKAELIIWDEVPIVPLYSNKKYILIKSNIKNVILSNINPIISLKNAQITKNN